MTTTPHIKYVNCPQCATPALWHSDNPFRPFCSERCKLIDLGQWATESYRIPVTDDNPFENEEGK